MGYEQAKMQRVGAGKDKNRGSVDFFWETESSVSPEIENSYCLKSH